MRKQVLLVTSLALLVVATAEAASRDRRAAPRSSDYNSSPMHNTVGASNHRMAGCGLGSLAVEDSSKWSQVGAGLLNITGMQTFGITFGTSNCTEDGVAHAAREKDAFVEANLADLRRDVAVGSGDYLSSLAALYGCKGTQGMDFHRALHKHADAVLRSSSEDASRTIDSAVLAERVSCQG